jgi:hypothetical protein
MPSGIARVMPIFDWAPKYQGAWPRPDLTRWLDFHSNDLSSAELSNDVDFVGALFLAKVVAVGTRSSDGSFGAELGGDERVEEAPDQVAVSHDGGRVDAKGAHKQRGINEVAFR